MNFMITAIFLISLFTLTPPISGSTLLESKPIVNDAKLILSLESGDSVVRRPRDSNLPQADTAVTNENAAPKADGFGDKRPKNGLHGNKKLSRNQDVNAPLGGGRNKHSMDKKPLTAGEQQLQLQQQQQQHMGKRQQLGNLNRQQHGSGKNNKQRQLLKSQQNQKAHQSSKRNNNHKAAPENSEHGSDGGGKTQSTCRYSKSAWTECDSRTNTHSRTLTLKRGDNNCLPTRTIQKKCKKSCRYEKGTWSECKDGQMTREDKLKAIPGGSAVSTSDSGCEAIRSINRKCNPDVSTGKSSSKSHQNGNGKTNKKERKNKEKANSRGAQQA